MDREITFALLVATTATVLMGSLFFQPPTAPVEALDRSTAIYATDDIRYPLQQAERKSLERRQRTLQRQAAFGAAAGNLASTWTADTPGSTPDY